MNEYKVTVEVNGTVWAEFSKRSGDMEWRDDDGDPMTGRFSDALNDLALAVDRDMERS